MIPPAAIVVIVARVPMPIPAAAIIAMAIVAGTEAEVNRRRFDDYSRLGIIDRGRCIIGLGCVITDRRSWRTIGCWPANDYPRQGRQREREPNSDVESHSGLRSRNGSEENGREQN